MKKYGERSERRKRSSQFSGYTRANITFNPVKIEEPKA